MRSILALVLLVPAAASAVPLSLSHQGRVYDALGNPVDGSHDLSFRLYDTASGGTALWTTDETLTVSDGYYTVVLDGFGSDDFDSDDLWIGLAVDSGPELTPRHALASVPFAIRAGTATIAESVSSDGPLDVTELTVGGTTVVNSDGTIDWGRLVNTDHTHSASEVDSGVLDIDRIPVGTSADDVAAGVHGHAASDVVSGTFDISRIPVGTGSTTVSAGDHSHDDGTIRFGDITDTCDDSSTALWGSVRFTGVTFEGCTEKGWVDLGYAYPAGTQAEPGLTCKTLLDNEPSRDSGLYWVDAGAGTAYETWCDMDFQGGGWTLVAHKNSSGSNILDAAAQGSAGEPYVSTTHFKLPTAFIDSVQTFSEDWRIRGSVTGREVRIAATGLPGGGWSTNEYGSLRSLLSGVGMSGCGSNTWDVADFYPFDGSGPGSPTCYAYPTTVNFYDFKSNPSGGNGQGQTIWLR